LTLIDNIVKDLVEADPKIKVHELLDHCMILGTHNGLTRKEVRLQFHDCKQVGDIVQGLRSERYSNG